MTLGNTQSDAHALVDTLAYTLAEVQSVTLGNTQSDAHAVMDTMADTVADLHASTLGDRRGDEHVVVDALADNLAEEKAENTRRETERFARTGRQTGLHACTRRGGDH